MKENEITEVSGHIIAILLLPETSKLW